MHGCGRTSTLHLRVRYSTEAVTCDVSPPPSFCWRHWPHAAAKTRSSDLALVHLEDFGPSYARTLHDWRERFPARREDVRAQGFDERFLRMWNFYLAYCEGGFRERSIGVAHVLMAKPGYRGGSYLPGLLEA